MKKQATIIEAAILLLSLAVLLLGGCTSPTGNDGKPPGVQPVYPAIDGFPAWSPDGSKIIYMHYGITKISPGGGHDINPDLRGLWMINADGSNPHLLLQGWDVYAAWSPEGRWIAFERGKQIYKVPVMGDSLDKSRIQQLTFMGENFFPAWSPDGEWIAYDSNVESPKGANFIWKMRADGSGERRIAYAPTEGETRQPNWSPDSKMILHIRYLVGTFSSEIFTMNENGGNPLRLTFNNSTDYNPQYSRDGRKIVFESQPQNGIPQVWIMNADGSNPQPLTTDGGIEPSWSPDGTKIVYCRDDFRKFDPHNGTVWVMNADGSNKRQLTYGPN